MYGDIVIKVWSPLRAMYYLLRTEYMLYNFALAVFAFLAFYCNEEMFLCFSMYDVVRNSEHMQKILRSFTKNINMVGYTFVFAIIVIYILVAWSFRGDYNYSFEDHTSCDDEDGDDHTCGGTLLDRFLLHLDYGLINPLVGTESKWHSWDAHLFGMMYYFIVNLVRSNLRTTVVQCFFLLTPGIS